MLGRVSYRAESAPGGWQVLRYHRQSVVLNQISTVFFVGMMGMMWTPDIPIGLRIFGTVVFGTFLAGSLCEWRKARRSLFSYSELGCYYVPTFAEPFSFGWEEIEQVEVAMNERSCLLRLTGRRKIRIEAWMNGFGQFLDEAGRKF